jgi:RHS repeat-associated protein
MWVPLQKSLPIDIGKTLGDDSADCSGCQATKLNPVAAKEGNPINVATGNKLQIETDAAGGGPYPLTFTRAYNSMAVTTTGVLGANWTHNYDARIANVSPTRVNAVRGDGKILAYTSTNSGVSWFADADVNSRLSWTGTGWKYITGADETELYNASGSLLSRANRAGVKHSMAYYTSGLNAGRLMLASDPFGHALVFSYDLSKRLIALQDVMGRTTTYGYGPANNLATVLWPDATSRRYVYENAAYPHALTGLFDESGTRYATWSYDSAGRAIRSQHAGGANAVVLDYAKGDYGAVIVTNAANNKKDYAFQTVQKAPRLIAQRDLCLTCSDSRQSYARFDDNGNPVVVNGPGIISNNATYNTARNLETKRDEFLDATQVRTTTTTWHPTYRIPLSIAEPTRKTTFAYDALGNLLSRTVSDTGAGGTSRQTRLTYNAYGEPLTVTDPLGRTTALTYGTSGNANGNLVAIRNPLGHITTIDAYNAAGQPLQTTDPNGLVTSFTYDARQRLTLRLVGGEATRYSYWPTGKLKTLTNPDGSLLSFTYDGAQRLTKVTNRTGDALQYTLDAMGNVVAERIVPALGAPITTRTASYDYLNRLASSSAGGLLAETTTYGYDRNNNLTRIADPLGHVTTMGYSGLDRLTTLTDALGKTATLTYDTADNLISVTDPRGLITSYGYNGFGEQTRVTSPDTGTTFRRYNAAGKPVSVTDALGVTATTSYDALDRVTAIQYAAMPWDQFTYDQTASGNKGIGRLTRMLDVTGTTQWFYDTRGHVIAKTQANGGPALTANWSFNATTGQLSKIAYPSGMTQSFAYDLNGRIASTYPGGAGISAVTWRPFGPVVSWAKDNVAAYNNARAYNADGTIASIAVKGTYADIQNYSYDAANRITQIAATAATTTYGYDADDRLTSFARGGVTQQRIAYDASGNRLSLTATAGVTNYAIAPASNRLTAMTGLGAQSNAYNARGDLVKMLTASGTTSFTYDARGRLRAATVPAGWTASYGVNGLGQRVSKSAASLPTGVNRYFYDNDGNLLGEYDATGVRVQEISYLAQTGDGPGTAIPVAINRAGAHYFINPDHLNSARSVGFANGQNVWTRTPSPFGEDAPNQNPSGFGTFTYNPGPFPGQYRDSETGLAYNMRRDYAPKTGRYVQSDPIGLAGGSFSTYGYVGGNPVGRVDPWGLDSYLVNRDLARFGGNAASSWNPATHTFTFTTNPDGSIAHTYSWGNDANTTGWNIDQQIDRLAASQAMASDDAQWNAPAFLDDYLAEAFGILDQKKNEHSNGWFFNNCKSEAHRLSNEAWLLWSLPKIRPLTPLSSPQQ